MYEQRNDNEFQAWAGGVWPWASAEEFFSVHYAGHFGLLVLCRGYAESQAALSDAHVQRDCAHIMHSEIAFCRACARSLVSMNVQSRVTHPTAGP